MKTISVKLPTLDKLSQVFDDIIIRNDGTGVYFEFGNESAIDPKNLDKTVKLEFSMDDGWLWVIDKNSFTAIDTDDLRTLFPKRKFNTPRRHTTVGCKSVSLNNNLDIVAGSHTLSEKEVQEIEELLALRRELKKK